MGILSAKSKFKLLSLNLSSTIFHRFRSTSTAPAPALSSNLKQHDNNKNLMLMVRVLDILTCDHCVISMKNNSFRVVQHTLPRLSFWNADYIVRACSNYKWMLLTCQKVPGPPYDLLWDPTTDETKPLPLSSAIGPPLPFPIYSLGWGVGVGFDPRPSGDYKVVRSQMFDYEGLDYQIRSEVLSIRTGSWKEIPYPYSPEFKPIENLALHINGFYYWLARHLTVETYAIIPFDFANEKFLPALIPMPKSKKLGYKVSVVPAEFHGSLAVIVHDFYKDYVKKKKPCFEIWVWGNDDWSCVDEFEVPADCSYPSEIFGLYKNDKVLIQDSNGDLLLYNCESRNLKNLGIHADSFNLRFYPYGKTTVNKGDKLVVLPKDSPQKFDEMTRAELIEIAKSKGIKGYSKLNKDKLVERICDGA